MKNPLSLHHLTTLDVDVVEFARIAGELSCPLICVFTQSLPGRPFPAVTDENEKAFVEALKRAGVSVYNTEFIAVTAQTDFEAAHGALARAARVGGRRMTVHASDTEEDRALASFRRVCRAAADEGLDVGLEWTAVNPAMSSLAQANRFLELADQPNAGLAVDVLHLSRAKDPVSAVAALPPGRVGYAQISDGPRERPLDEYAAIEFTQKRLIPGEGELPIADFVAALPAGVVVDVEAPQGDAMKAGVSPLERARRAAAGARAFLG